MSFPTYSTYKNSGIDWIGQIPSHWSTIPLAKVATQPGTLFIDGDWVESKDLADEGIRYITTGNVGRGQYKEQGSGYVSEDTFANLGCTEVKPGDVLISRLNLPVGRACVVPELGERIITSVDNVITRPNDQYSCSYISYMLSSKQHFANMEVLARGTTMQRISRSTLGHVRFALPKLDEQNKIASFLDSETAKIDALIAEQERLIELLQEKRQASISHAVTKGLKPNAPMKDSGVEWLGEVPGHWGIQKGSRIGKVFGSEQVPEENINQTEGIPFVKVSSLDGESFEPNQPEWFVQRSLLKAQKGEQGFLAFPKRGAAIFGNKVNIISGEAIIDPNVMGWRINPSVNPLYIAHTLKMRSLEEIADVSTVPQINNKHISQEWWPLPPKQEQDSICEFLEHANRSCTDLICLAKQTIVLLQERRSALISAAVTGQIDVRGLEPELEVV